MPVSARAYKLDVNLVRVVMIVLVFFGGLGLVTYVTGWILMPNETTPPALSDAEFNDQRRSLESERGSLMKRFLWRP